MALEDQMYSLVVELCTTMGDGMVRTATPDPDHVNPDRFATPDSKQDTSAIAACGGQLGAKMSPRSASAQQALIA